MSQLIRGNLVCSFFLAGISAFAASPMTNSDVLELSRKGASVEEIRKEICASKPQFNLDNANVLVTMGVSEEVILTMKAWQAGKRCATEPDPVPELPVLYADQFPGSRSRTFWGALLQIGAISAGHYAGRKLMPGPGPTNWMIRRAIARSVTSAAIAGSQPAANKTQVAVGAISLFGASLGENYLARQWSPVWTQSVAAKMFPCDTADQFDRIGRRCGGRSAEKRAGGRP